MAWLLPDGGPFNVPAAVMFCGLGILGTLVGVSVGPGDKPKGVGLGAIGVVKLGGAGPATGGIAIIMLDSGH